MKVEHFKVISMVSVLIIAGSIASMVMPVVNSMPVA